MDSCNYNFLNEVSILKEKSILLGQDTDEEYEDFESYDDYQNEMEELDFDNDDNLDFDDEES